MKVMFIPDARNKNLYQTNLSYSLSKLGVRVYFDNGSVIQSIIRYWPDILHVHWPYPFLIANSKFTTTIKSTSFICGLLLLKLFGMKVVWTVHNLTDHEGKFKYQELLFSKIFAKLCDKLIVHCLSAKIDVEKLYNKNESSIVIIPHGNYIGHYENSMTISEARRRLKFSEEDIIFLYFGQIRSYKGVPELIDTFKMLKNDKAKLLIVGKPLNEEIKANILNNCKDDDRIRNILEFIPDEDIQIYMNAADIVVLPYKNVLTSGAAILSISFGRPIIAPAVKCIVDTLDDKGCFLYRNNHLFEAMIRVLNVDREILQNMGMYNLQLAEKFGWDDIGKKTYNVYKER